MDLRDGLISARRTFHDRCAIAEEFAAEVVRVITHPDQVRVSAERRRTIAEELSPRTHAQNVQDIYSRVLMRKRAIA